MVDEAALVAALQNGRSPERIDVYERAASRLNCWRWRTSLLPHLEATLETREAMGRRALENIRLFASGADLRDRVRLTASAMTRQHNPPRSPIIGASSAASSCRPCRHIDGRCEGEEVIWHVVGARNLSIVPGTSCNTRHAFRDFRSRPRRASAGRK